MTTLPHDVSDLYLAPVVLALEARIEELGALTLEELGDTVALEADIADFTRELRQAGLVRTVQHLVDCHGWDLSWHPRGIRVAHSNHQLVLGVPESFRQFVRGTAQAAS